MKIAPVNNNDVLQKSSITSFREKAACLQQEDFFSTHKTPIIVSSVALATLGIGVAGARFKSNKAAQNVEKEWAKNCSEYSKKLSAALEKYLGKKIEPESLSCVISGEELLKELPNLKRENFVPSVQNIKNGIFLADLHSHSNFSDGKGEVKEILDNVAKYADKLNQINGKKFIYALTDHDGCEGVKKALSLISQNPQKYKNVKFVTASEISYLIKSNKTSNPYETSEEIGRASVGKECVRRCRSRWSPDH